ncbi:MAG: ATP-binding cassette domain-containing protein [Pseudomonadota bacterium]
MIHVENLKKYFGNIHAVDDVSFDVAKGEVVGLLGPNGAGKTTTMRIITGFLSADLGTVSIDGISIEGDGITARSRIGYLPENAPLYTDMEVSEYLGYIASLHAMPKREKRRAIKDMVEICGLDPTLGRRIGELSKGFRQRVGLAQAMIHSPPILILDEPTSGLDPNQIVEIRDLIKRIGRERTVVLSTHILQEARATCSRALIISSGKLVGHGTIAELTGRSVADAHYRVALVCQRGRIENEMEKLSDLRIDEWLSEADEKRQRFLLRCDDTQDRSEQIFRWAKENDLPLCELTRESASLEEVFRELTTSDQ